MDAIMVDSKEEGEDPGGFALLCNRFDELFPLLPPSSSRLAEIASQLVVMNTPILILFFSCLFIIYACGLTLDTIDYPLTKLALSHLTSDHAWVRGVVMATFILGIVIAISYLFMLLFVHRKVEMITGLLFVSYFCPSAAFSLFFLLQLFVAIDWVSLLLLTLNLSATLASLLIPFSTHMMHNETKGRYLRNGCILFFSLSVIWLFLCLDEIACWLTVVFLSIWDLVAVCLPWGPIRIVLVKEVEFKFFSCFVFFVFHVSCLDGTAKSWIYPKGSATWGLPPP